MIQRPMAIASFAILMVGCSDLLKASPLGTKSGRCDFRPKMSQCTDWREYAGPSMVVQQGLCTTMAATGAGTWAEGKTCEVGGMLGGCQSTMGDGSRQTNWFYSGDKFKTVDDVKKECGSATFVNPS